MVTLDNGESVHRILRLLPAYKRTALAHLYDLPTSYIVGDVIDPATGDKIRPMVVADLVQGVLRGFMNPDEVIALLHEAGLTRPVEDDAHDGLTDVVDR